MKTTTKNISDTKVEINVTLDAADLKQARADAIKNLSKHLKIQGFREGKAPLSMVEKNLNPNDIASETIDLAIRTRMQDVFNAVKIVPLAITAAKVSKYVPDESAEYVVTADILPDIKLGDFKNLKTKMENAEPSKQDIQDVVDNIVNAYAEKKAVKRAAQDGDEVIIDFVGKKDGVEFAGGSAKDHHLTLGSGQFIPGFEAGIAGHSAGDKFDLELTFPKDYPEKSLAGEKTVFEVLLKQVNEVVKPAEDDELAKKCGDFQTMDDLRADIKKNLEAQNRHRLNEKYRDDLVKELVEKSKISAPDILIQDQLRFIRDDIVRNAAAYGLTLEQYLERAGQTFEEWEKSASELAEARVKASLALQILARDQKITATEEEVEAKIAELKDVYKKSKEAMANLKKPEVRQDIKNRMIIDKAMDFLVAINNGKKAAEGKSAKNKESAKTTKAADESKKSSKTVKTEKTKKTSAVKKSDKAEKAEK